MNERVVTWRGRPLADFSREELIEIILAMQVNVERSHDNFLSLAKLNRRMLERRS